MGTKPTKLGVDEARRREELVGWVLEAYRQRRAARLPLELQWQLNLNFLLGNQYCDLDLTAARLIESQRQYPWQQREVFNHIAPIIEARLAKLGLMRPAMSVRPASEDSDDVATARVCDSILRAVSVKLRLPEVIREALHWSEICGSVFYKIRWDPTMGRVVGRDGKADLHEGELTMEVCPPFEIFPDRLDATDLGGCRSMIHAHIVDPSVIKERFGVDVAAQDLDSLAPGAKPLLGGWGYSAHAATVLPTKRERGVLMLEYYALPDDQYPNGRMLWVAGDQLVHEGDLPYPVGEDQAPGLPFIRQVSLQVPGAFFGMSVIERCIPIQRAYNAVKNRKHEYLNRLAMGVLAVEDGAVDTQELEDEGLTPGRVLVYRQGGSPPVVLQNGTVPPEFTYEEDRLRNEFILISGVSDMARYGGVTGGITSGVALDILREQDESRLSMSTDSLRQAIERAAAMWLRLYRRFARGPRIDRLTGENGKVLLLDWKSSDISSDDVICDSANELSQSLAQRRQMVMELLRMGLLNDPETGRIDGPTRRRALELLEFGRWETSDDLQALHATRAQLENRSLTLRDTAPTVDLLDEHGQHILEHTREYLTWRNQGGQEGKGQLLQEHILAHKAAQGQEQNDGMGEQV